MDTRFFPTEKEMSAEAFIKFQQLFNFDGFDSVDVINHARGPAYEQRVNMCKRMKGFCRKYGNPTGQLRLNDAFYGKFVPFLFAAQKEWDKS